MNIRTTTIPHIEKKNIRDRAAVHKDIILINILYINLSIQI